MTLYGSPRETPTPDDAPLDLTPLTASASAAVPAQRIESSMPDFDPVPDDAWLSPPTAEPEFGPLEPAVPVDPMEAGEPDDPPGPAVEEQVEASEPAEAGEATATGAPPAVAIDLDRWGDLGFEVDGAPEIQPWDRKPLMIAIAGGLVLVLIGVLAGIVSTAYFGPTTPVWQPGGGVQPTPSVPGPTPTPTASAAGVAGGSDGLITLSGVGDVIMGTLPGSLPPNDGAGFFDPVKAALASDLVMGNLESALSANTGKVKCAPTSTLCFQFYLPPSYANHLKEGGFDVMNLANNHTNDMGPVGLRNTRAALDAAGVGYTGAPNEIKYVDVKGVRVAVLGFAVYSWGQNLNNIPAAKALVAKAKANADIVVIQMQGGAEGTDKAHVKPGHEFFAGEDRGDEVAFSHAVIDAGADVIFGHGPHVMRGMEFYKGRLIAYSLGNFCGYKTLSANGYSGVGGVLRVTLKKDGSWADGTLVATEMVRGGLVQPDSDKRALGFVNGLSGSDFGARAATIDTVTGRITPPDAG